MNFFRLKAVTRKEFIHIYRDFRSLGLAIAIPMLLLLLFGYALTVDIKNVPLVIWDQSHTPLSRDFISQFTGSPYFKLRSYVTNYHQLSYAIDTKQALIAIVIPHNFASLIETGQRLPIQLIIDGSDANTAILARGYAEAVIADYSQNVTLKQIQHTTGSSIEMPVDFQPRVWFNEDLESKNYIIPGLIAIILIMIAAFLTSLTVAKEWENGTMEQLISTPIKRSELILGKLLPYFTIGIFDVLLVMLVSEFVFHIPFRGSVFLFFSLVIIYLVGALSLGLFISIVTKHQLLSTQLSLILTFLPSFILSGFMFEISNMPKVIQLITYLIPARYCITILRGIYLKGIGIKLLFLETGLMIIFCFLMVTLVMKGFKKKLI